MATNTAEAALQKVAPIAKKKLNHKIRASVFRASVGTLIVNPEALDLPEGKALAKAILAERDKISQSELAVLAKWKLTRNYKQATLGFASIKASEFLDDEGEPFFPDKGGKTINVWASPYHPERIADFKEDYGRFSWERIRDRTRVYDRRGYYSDVPIFPKGLEAPSVNSYHGEPKFNFDSFRHGCDVINGWYDTKPVKTAWRKLTLALGKSYCENERRVLAMVELLDMATTVGDVVEALPFTADAFSAELLTPTRVQLPAKITAKDKQRLCSFMQDHHIEGSTLCK